MSASYLLPFDGSVMSIVRALRLLNTSGNTVTLYYTPHLFLCDNRNERIDTLKQLATHMHPVSVQTPVTLLIGDEEAFPSTLTKPTLTATSYDALPVDCKSFLLKSVQAKAKEMNCHAAIPSEWVHDIVHTEADGGKITHWNLTNVKCLPAAIDHPLAEEHATYTEQWLASATTLGAALTALSSLWDGYVSDIQQNVSNAILYNWGNMGTWNEFNIITGKWIPLDANCPLWKHIMNTGADLCWVRDTNDSLDHAITTHLEENCIWDTLSDNAIA